MKWPKKFFGRLYVLWRRLSQGLSRHFQNFYSIHLHFLSRISKNLCKNTRNFPEKFLAQIFSENIGNFLFKFLIMTESSDENFWIEKWRHKIVTSIFKARVGFLKNKRTISRKLYAGIKLHITPLWMTSNILQLNDQNKRLLRFYSDVYINFTLGIFKCSSVDALYIHVYI